MFQQDFRTNAKSDDIEKKNLTLFCTQTIRKLMELERKHSKKPSTMKHFVRLDLGWMHDGEKPQFFVNEITRAYKMYLFSSNLKDIDLIKIAGGRGYDSIKEIVESTL